MSNIDPKQVNNDRLSPVHLAIDRDHHQSMLALLIYYMKPEEERDTDGMSMLERAVDKHSWACFYHLILQAGTDWIDVKNEEGRSARSLAKDLGFTTIVDSILNNIRDGVTLEDFTVFDQDYEKQTLIPFDEIYLKHAGFNEEM